MMLPMGHVLGYIHLFDYIMRITFKPERDEEKAWAFIDACRIWGLFRQIGLVDAKAICPFLPQELCCQSWAYLKCHLSYHQVIFMDSGLRKHPLINLFLISLLLTIFSRSWIMSMTLMEYYLYWLLEWYNIGFIVTELSDNQVVS